MTVWSDRRAAAAERVLKDGFSDVLDTVRPDLVVSDCEHHVAILQSLAAGKSLVLLSFIYQAAPGPQTPPVNADVVPGRGLSGSTIGIRLSWLKLAAKKRAGLARARWAHWGADFTTAHRKAAARLAVTLDRLTTRRGFQMPWSYQLPTLFLLSDRADFPTLPTANQTFAGPMILRTRAAGEMGEGLRAFLQDVPGTHRIYAAFGSIRQPPKRFVRALAEVARTNPSWRVLIANLDPTTLDEPPPDNMTFVPWAPQLEALGVADCAIFHGGAGTLNECLATATPMLIYPNALDGKGNGARVVAHGLGTVGAYDDSADKLARDIRHVLTAPDIRARLKEHQAHIAQMAHAQIAERVIAQVLEAPRPA
ncbi:MAG: glycosyltransferase [Pseudomonadota bacterium]